MAIDPIKWPALSEWKQILVRTWKESGDDNVGLLAAGVAFYIFLAFVPLLASIVLTYGLIADPATVSEHIQSLARSLPREAAAIIADQLQSIAGSEKGSSHGFGLLLAIALALYGASKGSGAIIKALNIAYEVKDDRGFIKSTLMSLAMTVGLVVIVLAAASAISALAFIEHLLPFSSPLVHFVLQLLLWAVALVVVGLGIALLYRYGPNRPDAPWAWVTPGSAAATLLWLLASLGFGLYVSNFGDYNATYGSLGGVVVFLTWIYITAFVLLMGGELNSELERQQAEKNPALAAAAGPRPGGAADGAQAAPSGPAAVSAPARVPAARPARLPAAKTSAPGRSGVAVVLGAAAALGLGIWGRRRKSVPDTQFYRYPEEGASLRLGG
jgi:membrane protein